MSGTPMVPTVPPGRAGEVLGSVEVTVDQTIAAGAARADVTGAAVTVNCDGGPVEVILEAQPYSASAGGTVYLTLMEDGADIRQLAFTSGSASATSAVSRRVTRTPTPGPHTYKVQINAILGGNVGHSNGSALSPLTLTVKRGR